MATEINRDPDLEWLDHVPPVGLVVAPTLLKELGLSPLRQTPIDTGAVADTLGSERPNPPCRIHGLFVEQVLGWEARHVAGAPGGPAIPDELLVALLNMKQRFGQHGRSLSSAKAEHRWQLLVRVEAAGDRSG